jgi:hypothetical protein
MNFTVENPDNNSENSHHRNLKTVKIIIVDIIAHIMKAIYINFTKILLLLLMDYR